MNEFRDANNNIIELPAGEQIGWRISAYAVILNDVNQLLMVMPHYNNQWQLPGGGLETSETIAEGVAREVYEETGFKVELDSSEPVFVGESNFYKRGDKKFYKSIMLFYFAKLRSDIREENSMNEKRVEWVDISTLDQKNCHPIVLPVLDRIND